MNIANNMSGLISRAEQANPKRGGDYEQDGLLHCGQCHTAKQCRIEWKGEILTVACLCKCASEQYEKERKEEAKTKRMAEIKALRINGIQDKSIRAMTFKADKGKCPDLIAKAQRYVDSWDKMARENVGIVFWGNTGNGKTFTAACIANALIDKGVPVLMTSFPKLLSAITGVYAEERLTYIDSLCNFKLLVIDDLGAERGTEYALEQVYSVVDARYKQKLPTVFTTNLTLEELKKPKDMTYQRVYDRVLEMCVPIHATGESLRKEAATEKMRLIKSLEGG